MSLPSIVVQGKVSKSESKSDTIFPEKVLSTTQGGRLRHSTPDFVVYRNRLQLDHPARLGEFRFKPFLADEVWYSNQPLPTGSPGWFRNRISAGIIKQLSERFNITKRSQIRTLRVLPRFFSRNRRRL
jgi:hypothetical protein